jgi:hypothetical protein
MAQKWRLFTVVREVDDELRRAGVRDRTACNAAKKATTERPFVFNLHIVCKKAVSCQDRLGADVGKIASRKERKEGPFSHLAKENVPRLFVTSRGSSLISACFHFFWTSGSPETPVRAEREH